MYECDELPGFIRECIGRVETMAPERIEETLIGFIRKSVYTHTVNTHMYTTNRTSLRQFSIPFYLPYTEKTLM